MTTATAQAHGIWGHVHVTGWAVENMEDDDLRAFLLEPEVFNALIFGAVFADTGYARNSEASRAYSEHTHWEPFVQDFIEWIEENDPPPWTTLASRRRIGFLLGCASHGLQDAMFDSLFLHQVEERDGVGQDATDPGTDGFLVLDGHIRFVPEQDIPMSAVLELYEVLGPDVTEDVILDSVGLTMTAYVNDDIGLDFARFNGEKYAESMPWGRAHYLDPEVPGSLRAEIYPTMRYQEAIWKRLRGELGADELTVFAFPESTRRLRSGEPGRADSWVTLVFGAGVPEQGDIVSLTDDAGEAVAFEQSGNRWGSYPTRMLRLQPTEPLTPGGWYTATMRAGVERIDGQTTTQEWALRFQVACIDEGDPACPALDPPAVASIDGVPPEPEPEPGCGCQVAGLGGGWVGVGLLGLLSRRRRSLG